MFNLLIYDYSFVVLQKFSQNVPPVVLLNKNNTFFNIFIYIFFDNSKCVNYTVKSFVTIGYNKCTRRYNRSIINV